MSLLRHSKRRDANEPEIVEALRSIGAKVWRLDQPCDLLTLYRGRWQPLEVKTKAKLGRKDQPDQAAFIAQTGTPVVTTSLEALQAIGAFGREPCR